ncbi:MAG: hypothetical protein KIG43_05870 [Eubacteriales bacterium]|nr:hypothetical protein [Eubacteriales bacterium]MCI7570097.1 hypothetical protein [Clostridiales bacterium]MDD7551240.1 hypothetical protein [Clostridia bacterium]MDY5755070.1 hypothetical protein [Eubacteriales bacterium]
MSELLEMIMMICFGVSWPLSIIKSFTARTTTGKSVVFLVCIFTGYICGIASKLMQEKVTYVLVFYIINAIMVFIDIILYIRNSKLDKKRAVKAAVEG